MKKAIVHDKRIDVSEISKLIIRGDAIDSISFIVPRYQTGTDLSLYDMYLRYENDAGIGEDVLLSTVSDTGCITCVWKVNGGFTQDKGQHKIQLWCSQIVDNVVTMKWQTYPALIEVNCALDPKPIAITTPTILEEYLSLYQSIAADALYSRQACSAAADSTLKAAANVDADINSFNTKLAIAKNEIGDRVEVATQKSAEAARAALDSRSSAINAEDYATNAKESEVEASMSATKAKAQADRAAAISASIKRDEGFSYANQLVGTKNSTLIHCNDMVTLRDISIEGDTTQDGIPTPDAPISLQSVINPKLICAGNNLFSPSTVKIIGSINTLTDADYIYLPKGKYIISHAKTINTDRFCFRLRKNGAVVEEETVTSFSHFKMYSQGSVNPTGYYNANEKYYLTGSDVAWEYMVIELVDNDYEVAFLRFNNRNTGWENVQLEKTDTIASRPSNYTAHQRNVYGYSATLDKWDSMHVDNIAKKAWIQRGTGTKVFDGTEAWSNEKDPFIWCHQLVLKKKTFDNYTPFICSHFIYREEECDYLSVGECSSERGEFKFATNTPNLQEFLSYLAAQQAANTPVTIKYQLFTPTIEELDYHEVIAQKGVSTIWNNAGTSTTIKYGQDINIAFAKLQNAILILGGNV